VAYPRDVLGLEQLVRKSEEMIARTPASDDPETEHARLEALVDLGECLRRLGRFEEAIDAFSQVDPVAVPIDRTLIVMADTGRATALAELGHAEEALDIVERALGAARVVHDELWALAVLSCLSIRLKCFERLGLDDDAYVAATEAIREIGERPGEAEDGVQVVIAALVLQGRVSLERGDSAQALEKLDEAVKLFEPLAVATTDGPRAVVYRARAHENLGDRWQAGRGYHWALKWGAKNAEPRDPELDQALADAKAGWDRVRKQGWSFFRRGSSPG
jgi:tetratricopeptide (TPR) repeat protein